MTDKKPEKAKAGAPAEAPLDEELLLDHEYDGIREYDNPLPRWWVTIFWGSFVFALCYFLWYSVLGKGKGRLEEYREDVAQAEAIQAKRTMAEKVTEQSLDKLAKNSSAVSMGSEVFHTRCLPCHGDHAQGVIGPNLTDGYWIHGNGTLMDIYKTVDKGVADKGMPTWGKQLKPKELRAVVAYVGTLRNTNVKRKPPQGHQVKSLK